VNTICEKETIAVDQLWAPWRLSYIAKAVAGENEPCFICSGDQSAQDRENLVAHRTARSIVILNRFPYNNGHLLVAPRRHIGDLAQLTPEELLDSLETVRQMVKAIEETMQPDGFNIGLNLGRPAGAGLPGHLHWHIVPRWIGDTNFMPVLGDVKVISQSLDAFWVLLTQHLSQRFSGTTQRAGS
jgi:ATP adenylyltransferase